MSLEVTEIRDLTVHVESSVSSFSKTGVPKSHESDLQLHESLHGYPTLFAHRALGHLHKVSQMPSCSVPLLKWFVRSCWGLLGVASGRSVPVFACTRPHLTHLPLRKVQITERTPVMIPQVSWSMQTRLKNRYCITQPVDQAILTHVRTIQSLDPGPMALWTSIHYHSLVYIQACTIDYSVIVIMFV